MLPIVALALVNVCYDHLLLIAIENELTYNLKCDLICCIIVQTRCSVMSKTMLLDL